MNESFNRFKRRVWRNVLIKCALASCATAFLAVDAVLLPCLLCSVHLLWVWYVLIALGGLTAGFGIAFLCLRTDDNKIAQLLDSEFALSERVQTAYVYRDAQGDMLQMQRQDADAALCKASVQKLRFGNIALAVILTALLVLSVAALPIIAVYAATPEQPVTPVDPPRDVTDWEWQALDELIDYVKASNKATEQAKSGMAQALENLRGVLKNGVSQSSLKEFVQAAVTDVRNAVSLANEQDGISDEQKTLNGEEEQYVIARLYEIFGLQQNGSDPSNPPPEGDKDEPVSPGNNTGTGELVVSGVPFFDPEAGYVSSGDPETREKYYETIRQAMLEGTISRSEWEYIVATYFADLQEPDK